MAMKNASFVCALALTMAAGAAQATTVTLDYTTPGSPFGGNGSVSATISSNGGADPKQVIAGGFSLTDVSGPAGDIVAWCVDLASTLKEGFTYTASGSGGFTATIQQQLSNLFNNSYTTLDLSDNAQSGGFQLAIWEIIYGSGELDVTLGSFQVTNTLQSAINAANAFLADLGTPSDPQLTLAFLNSATVNGNKSQDLVTVAPIPLPAAAWLLLAGLGGLAVVGRRRRGDAAA